MTENQGRILVIRGGTIGEFVLTCPVFVALREQFPGVGLEVLGYPRIAQLAKAAGLVDEIRSIETRAAAGFFARNAPLDEDLAEYFARFSVIFSYLYDPDGYFQGNVAKVSPAQFIAGPARPDTSQARHAGEVFLQPLTKLAIFGADAIPRLALPAQPPSPAGPWVALHLASYNVWGESKWRALVALLLEKTGYRILLVGGDVEDRLLKSLANLSERTAVRRNAAPLELAAEIAGCHAFIGHDADISHLAAATQVPCVVIWGAANETVWSPRGKNVTLLKNRAGPNVVSVEQVLAALPMIWSGAE